MCRWIKLIVPFCLCSLLYLGGCAAVPSPADRDEAEADEPLLPALKAQKATSENSDLTETEEAVFAAAADPNEEDGEEGDGASSFTALTTSDGKTNLEDELYGEIDLNPIAQQLGSKATEKANQQTKLAAQQSLKFKTPLAPIEVAAEKKTKAEKKPKTWAWFAMDDRFVRQNDDGTPRLHPFFDFPSRPGKEEFVVNFIPITPAGSDYRYNFNLVSGRFYKEANYCPQNDVWRQYRSLLTTPPYTMGFIPRLLDQTGQLQQVIVLGNDDYYQQHLFATTPSRVRIVGGVVEQYCAKYPCLNVSSWTSRPILIAVDAQDGRYMQNASLQELKKHSSRAWREVIAFLENSKGRTIIGREQFPAYRISGEIKAEDAVKYVFHHGHQFTVPELQALRKNCFALYDYIWQRIVVLREQVKSIEKLNVRNLQEMSESGKVGEKALADFLEVNAGDLRDTEQQLALKKLELLKYQVQQKVSGTIFKDFFSDFFSKYGRDYGVCARYVPPSNINYDLQRHWFFAYLTGLMIAEEQGMHYACLRKAWVPQDQLGEQDKGKEAWESCTESLLDAAFASMPALWQRFATSGLPYYRYIDFDNTSHGSHQRIYAWVPVTNKSFACVKDGKTVKPRWGAIWSDSALLEVFPEDAPWPKMAPALGKDHLFVE